MDVIKYTDELSSPVTERKGAVGIINYGAGNIFSLVSALDRLGVRYGMVHRPEDFEGYDRYIIPGVGHAGAAMKKLLDTGLVDLIRELERPVLGVCVGMQLLTAYSEEGNSDLTGIIPLQTKLFNESLKLKVPHTGWNKVRLNTESALFSGLKDEYFYFVHSYHIEFNSNFTVASTDYGIRFSAAIRKDNFYGVQFHPEKSGKAGEQLLLNFIGL